MAPRGPRKAKAPTQNEATTALISALKFASIGQKDESDNAAEVHCFMTTGWVAAFNGILCAAHPIADEIQACPHTGRLISALERCGASLSVTQADADRLLIKSGKFQAFVPCIAPALAFIPPPDAPIAPIDDRLKKAFKTAGVLASDNATELLAASVLLNGSSVVATNRHVMIEYWHGNNLPPNIILPKMATAEIAKVEKPLKMFGFSETSATFYFEDGSWIRTQLYNDSWPDYKKILDVKIEAEPIPASFFAAVDAVASFSDDGFVYFGDDTLRSHKHGEVNAGASYEIKGLTTGPAFNSKYLKLIEPLAQSIDFCGPNRGLYFIGDMVRGAIAGRTV